MLVKDVKFKEKRLILNKKHYYSNDNSKKIEIDDKTEDVRITFENGEVKIFKREKIIDLNYPKRKLNLDSMINL